jgi:hypothetical protein
MIKSDFPSKWPQFMNQILTCLSTDNIETWNSALLVFYTLVQYYEYTIFNIFFSLEFNDEGIFRYKKAEDRVPMDDVMIVILPLLHQRFMQLFAHDDSDQSAFIQKQILKIFHAYTQVRITIF